MRDRLRAACASPQTNLVCGLLAGCASLALMAGAYSLGRDRPRVRGAAPGPPAALTALTAPRVHLAGRTDGTDRCAGSNRDGARCRRPTADSSGYCHSHRGQMRAEKQ
jgi:hypothetical protein